MRYYQSEYPREAEATSAPRDSPHSRAAIKKSSSIGLSYDVLSYKRNINTAFVLCSNKNTVLASIKLAPKPVPIIFPGAHPPKLESVAVPCKFG